MMKILIMLLSAAFYRIGGSDKEKNWPKGVDKKGARIIGLPALISFSLALINGNILYLFNFLPMQALRLGDGIPQGKDRGSFLGRIFKRDWLTSGIVQGINVVAAYSIRLYLTRDIEGFFVYVIVNVVVAASLKYLKAPDWMIEPGRGAALATIIYL
jgi:hypothetical protein